MAALAYAAVERRRGGADIERDAFQRGLPVVAAALEARLVLRQPAAVVGLCAARLAVLAFRFGGRQQRGGEIADPLVPGILPQTGGLLQGWVGVGQPCGGEGG